MWGNAIERAALLRTRHIIRPTTFRGPGIVCERDGVRVHPVKGGWRHDTREMIRVNEAAAAMAQPSQLAAL